MNESFFVSIANLNIACPLHNFNHPIQKKNDLISTDCNLIQSRKLHTPNLLRPQLERGHWCDRSHFPHLNPNSISGKRPPKLLLSFLLQDWGRNLGRYTDLERESDDGMERKLKEEGGSGGDGQRRVDAYGKVLVQEDHPHCLFCQHCCCSLCAPLTLHVSLHVLLHRSD